MEAKEYDLQSGQELRIELDFDQEVTIVLEIGRAEKFGQEFPVGYRKLFQGPDKFAIFTWHGCKLTVSGQFMKIYVSTAETPMPYYLAAHGQINRMRYEAACHRRPGPTVLVAGGPSCGKSTVCKILLNYAVKCAWRPIMVELDVTNNEMFLPGCVSAASYYQNSWDSILSYFYGHTSFNSNNLDFFKNVVTELQKQVDLRISNEFDYCCANFSSSYAPQNNAYASGSIINLPPFHDMDIYEKILNFVIECFKVDIVLIIDQERLLSSLSEQGFKPMPLSKSGGVVSLDSDKVKIQNFRLNSYFSRHQSFQKLLISEIKVYKVTVSATPLSARTYGDTSQGDGLIVTEVGASQEVLFNAVLGVLIGEDVMKSPIYGIVHVVEVDETHIGLLSPGDLPSKRFLLGSVKTLKQ